MLQRSISISLGTTSIVGAGGLIGAYWTGGFTDTYPMKTIVWKDKPTSVPAIDKTTKQISDISARNMWAQREMEFLTKTSGKVDHPWWKELLKDFKDSDELNVPVLIAKWCMKNNDTDIDVTSDKAEMLQKLCGVSFS